MALPGMGHRMAQKVTRLVELFSLTLFIPVAAKQPIRLNIPQELYDGLAGLVWYQGVLGLGAHHLLCMLWALSLGRVDLRSPCCCWP